MSPAQGMEDEAFFGPFRLEMRSEVTQKDIELRRTAALRGKILDSDGAALASARVAVVRENDSDERGAAYEFDSRLAETATNPSGAFSFRDLPSQVGLRLRVSHTRVATHVTDPLRLAASAQDEIVIRLERDGVLRGHVVDESDLPLPEVLLQVARVGQEQSVIASAKTDADGWFQLTRVPPGQLIAWARMPGRLDAMLALGTLAAGEERDGLLLRMPPIPPLRGIVVDESGTPISGVNVFARDTRAGTILEEQSTGADGTFSWPHIPAGIYGVFARPVGEFGSVIGGNVQHPRSEPFKIVLR